MRLVHISLNITVYINHFIAKVWKGALKAEGDQVVRRHFGLRNMYDIDNAFRWFYSTKATTARLCLLVLKCYKYPLPK